jgi:hypothetical protein
MRTLGTGFVILIALRLFTVAEAQSADSTLYLAVDGDVSTVLKLTESEFKKLP